MIVEKILVKEVILPIVIIISFVLLYMLIHSFIKRITKIKFTKTDDKRKKTLVSLINNIVKYFLMIVAILMILNIYNIDTTAILASLGAVSVVAGLAFQDTLKDFLAGFFIIFENQYAIGDTVTIGGFKGEVISLGLKTTRLKAWTGEVKIISNRNIDSVVNHSLDKSVAVIEFQVSYEEDLDHVESVLTNLFERLNKEIKGIKGKISLLGIDELAESGITYKVAVDTIPMKNLEIERKLLKEIKMELDKNHIDIPYNQVVIHRA